MLDPIGREKRGVAGHTPIDFILTLNTMPCHAMLMTCHTHTHYLHGALYSPGPAVLCIYPGAGQGKE